VNTLYASTRALAISALVSSVVTVAVAVRAGLWPLNVTAGLIVLVGVGRLALSLTYNTAKLAGLSEGQILGGRIWGGRIWEGAYQLAAASYAGLLGLFAFLTLLLAPDSRLHMLATTMAIGFASGIGGRNSGRPAIALTKLTLAVLPVAIGLLLTGNGMYEILGVATLLFFAGMIDVTLQTYDILQRAFRSARENEGLVEAVQIKASEAFAASDAKTRFLANMSHEIRTPLNGVLGMTEAMLGDALSDQQRARLGVIRQSGGALMTLLNDILDLSKVEAGKLEIESAPFHLGELMASVAASFEDVAAKRGLGLSVVASAKDLGVYEGDGGRLRQILSNLISNALKFTEAGRVEVTAAVKGGMLELAVSDTGIGISPAHLERLFQRFSQADASTTRRFGGTGLGLAICQELTTLLSGRIRAESRLGEGSTFFVSIPLISLAPAEVAMSPAEIEPAAPTAAPAGNARQVRLLCAEDNEINQMVLKALLEPYNYDLILVDNGLQALEAYKREAFDLILLDIQMPLMDGPTAAAAIRLYETQTNRPEIPIIALTANVMFDQVQSYLASGMNQVVPKPINIDELYAAIEHHLSRSSWLGSPESADFSSQPMAGVG